MAVKKTLKRSSRYQSKTPTKIVTRPLPKTILTSAAKSSTPTSAVKMPAVGSKAPSFSLPDHDGKIVTLDSLKGKKAVIYFYPKDDTSGCTLEAKGFSADYAAFKKKGVAVFGISKDDAKSHCKFRDKYGLTFPLLSDTTGAIVAAYGCWVQKSLYGRKYMGIQRATFLIDENGRIAKVWPNVTPDGHSKEVLGSI